MHALKIHKNTNHFMGESWYEVNDVETGEEVGFAEDKWSAQMECAKIAASSDNHVMDIAGFDSVFTDYDLFARHHLGLFGFIPAQFCHGEHAWDAQMCTVISKALKHSLYDHSIPA